MPEDALPIEPHPRTDAAELVERARAGDESALSHLIAGVSAFTRRIAKKYARRVPGTDVDDLEQAGLIAVGQCVHSYKSGTAWNTYAMAAAARGVAREANKAKRLSSRFPTPDEGTEVDCESLPDALSLWDPGDSGLVSNVQEAMGELDPIDRAMIELAHGLTGERLEGNEIAGRLGLRSRRIGWLLHRAETKLRQILAVRGLGEDSHGKA